MKSYTSQLPAAAEGVIPDAGNAIRNRDTRQTRAVTKGPNSDAGDAIWNRDAR